MTANELRAHLASLGYPATFEVDGMTFAHACKAIFEHHQPHAYVIGDGFMFIDVALGPHGGLMFKNVELILT